MRPAILLAATGASTVALLLWTEAVDRAARRRGFGASPAHGPTEAVVVLGYRNRGHRANAINRARVRAALRARSPTGHSSLVLCGGAVGSRVPEAQLMADYARSRGAREPILCETRSRTTWENVANAIPLIHDADRILVVSGALHAEKARIYLRRQRPDLARRLLPAGDLRFGELLPLRPVMTLVGLANLRRLRREGARAGTTV